MANAKELAQKLNSKIKLSRNTKITIGVVAGLIIAGVVYDKIKAEPELIIELLPEATV